MRHFFSTYGLVKLPPPPPKQLTNKQKSAEELLRRAAGLVGNPCTNISASTDIACIEWQKNYDEYLKL